MTSSPTPSVTTQPFEDSLIPKPVTLQRGGGQFNLDAQTRIYVPSGNAELLAIGQILAELLKLEVTTVDSPPTDGISLALEADPALGEEGYGLTVSQDSVKLTAATPAGAFYAVQTLRQLLPPVVDPARPQSIPAVTIRDMPRFAWRGAMLDVARHFFSVADVQRYIDLMALYKFNRLHLHLTDDQGWRIEIKSWPKLTEIGGSTETGGGPGGYYTQEQYAEIVEYAAQRYIIVVPEIDMPGHTNAALVAYPELSCAESAPKVYTGTEVGFSYLCAQLDITYRFIDDVIRELAALTPGPYIHIGGDEAHQVSQADYTLFVENAQEIVVKYGKQPVGWEEIAQGKLVSTAIVQHWASAGAQNAVQQGAKVILSPAAKSYLDMKYEASTKLGQDWAGFTSVQDAYIWDPGNFMAGISEKDVLGVEAALWTETIATFDDIEFMLFPRLLGIAEIGWSPTAGRNWNEYRQRLAAHGPRLLALGVDFYPANEVPWK